MGWAGGWEECKRRRRGWEWGRERLGSTRDPFLSVVGRAVGREVSSVFLCFSPHRSMYFTPNGGVALKRTAGWVGGFGGEGERDSGRQFFFFSSIEDHGWKDSTGNNF